MKALILLACVSLTACSDLGAANSDYDQCLDKNAFESVGSFICHVSDSISKEAIKGH
ncbi:hypothetical protein [Vibrio harveyi]|uniref:hypothetical protein n=1 Tax=Vibrio harveyi TaxID=669 RepID=UPI001EEECF37|nr:hypothetical protein [Vibrio harveyi]